MTRWCKDVNGVTLILADVFVDNYGNVMELNTSAGSRYALQHGFEEREIADPPPSEILQDVNADEIDSMNMRERGAVLMKVVKHLKGIVASFAVMLSVLSLGEVQTAQLGDLKDSSSIVTNISGLAEIQATAQSAKQKADSHDASIVQLNNAVGSWSRYWGGDDFVVTVTNYPSAKGANRSPSGYMPNLFMSWKTQDDNGEWYQQIVWDQRWWQDWLTDIYLPTNYVPRLEFNRELNQKADRAWGFYDSHSGFYSPEGFTQISSPSILIAANLAYQQTITSSGSFWILTYTGEGVQTGNEGDYFKISDAEGKSVFEIVKGNKRTVGAVAGAVQTVAGATPKKLSILYAVESDNHPLLYVCDNLRTQNWKAEDDPDCGANVSWGGGSGNWRVEVQSKAGVAPQLFVKATYEVGGETYIKNHAPVSMEYIYVGGQKYRLSVETVNGKKLLVLTDAL